MVDLFRSAGFVSGVWDQARPSKTKTKIATVKHSFSHGSGKGPCRRQVGERQFLGRRAAAVPPPGASRGIQHTRRFRINFGFCRNVGLAKFQSKNYKLCTKWTPSGRFEVILIMVTLTFRDESCKMLEKIVRVEFWRNRPPPMAQICIFVAFSENAKN